MNRLHPDDLRRAICEHQLSCRELAELLNVEPSDIMLASSMPVGTLIRLAELLGRSPLGHHVDGPSSDSDLARLGAHLVGAANGVTRDDLAYALGWTLRTVERTIAELDAALGELGIRVIALDDRLHLGPRLEHTEPTSRRRIARSGTAALDPEIAEQVYLCVTYTNVIRSEASLVALEHARRLGLVEYGGAEATAPVMFSLCLDDT